MQRLLMLKSHVSEDFINLSDSDSILILEINRPEARNALNFEIIGPIISSFEKTMVSRKPVLITGMISKFFGAGGDLKLVTKHHHKVPEFLRSLDHMYYLAFLHEKSISIWTGYVIGGGAGLASACKLRVAMASTQYSMPENKIGLFPNAGATYFLTHYMPFSLGLFIGLTGITLNGADCFYSGLCNFYIDDQDYTHVMSESKAGDPESVIRKYHQTPKKGKIYAENLCVMKDLSLIQEFFGNCQSLEEIVERLDKSQLKWAKNVRKVLNEMCPLSLKVNFEAFKRGKTKTFRECLEMEFTIENNMMVHYRYNFYNGVVAKLEKRVFLDWIPARVSMVNDEMVAQLFENMTGLALDLSVLTPHKHS